MTARNSRPSGAVRKHAPPFSFGPNCMAAIFTTADRDAVKSAIITAATAGVASVSVGGQAVTTYSLSELKMLLNEIISDLAADNTSSAGLGMRFRVTKPPGAG
jgi:hypothetical protein